MLASSPPPIKLFKVLSYNPKASIRGKALGLNSSSNISLTNLSCFI